MTLIKKEQLLQSKQLYSGNIISVKKDTVRLENGKEVTREVVEHSPAAVIVPIDKNNKVYLIEQYRHATGQIILEAPAGCLNLGEDPLVGAKRELKEETGFVADEWKKVAGVYMTPGFCDEFMHVYSAKGLTKGSRNLDPDERINVKAYSFEEIDRLIQTQEIIDGKTILAYLLAKEQWSNA